jgi:hypothetical protein
MKNVWLRAEAMAELVQKNVRLSLNIRTLAKIRPDSKFTEPLPKNRAKMYICTKFVEKTGSTWGLLFVRA